MARVFVDDTGARLGLGAELGRGGEGVVYDLPGTALAAKIYHRAAEPAKADKLEAMVRLRAPALSKFSAWPGLGGALASFLGSEAISARTDDDCTLVLACRCEA